MTHLDTEGAVTGLCGAKPNGTDRFAYWPTDRRPVPPVPFDIDCEICKRAAAAIGRGVWAPVAPIEARQSLIGEEAERHRKEKHDGDPFRFFPECAECADLSRRWHALDRQRERLCSEER